jgi:hypothetical protein
MLYAIAIGVVVLAVYWLWGMRKMVRMNKDPDQLALVHLLIRAGKGRDEELLAFIGEQRWTRLQVADHVAQLPDAGIDGGELSWPTSPNCWHAEPLRSRTGARKRRRRFNFDARLPTA